MTLFAHPDFDDHERILFAHDAASGLEAIVAIHSTRLGPAAGGCRMWPYASEEEAIADALRLSRGMTYKNAVAGLDLGGGKAVIIADPRTQKTPELLRAFGRAVETLGGRYVTAEDVGVSVEDMEIVRETTAHVAGLSSGAHASGDPSPVTARGVFEGVRRAMKVATGSDDLAGRTVAVQGLGHVGRHLCALLHAAGARLVVSDIDPARIADAERVFDARAVAPDAIVATEADVFAPCALGGVLDDVSIPRLKARIVAGAANNQLARPEHADALHARGILYVPDFALNAGGIINVAREIEGRTDERWLDERLARMVDNIEAILVEARDRGVSPNGVAEAFARARLA
ncbi:Glu/Leu/Phe/Val dehydrogenase [Salinarimonas ramus]|uniref:Leucine dehydrogenase n=1 Tax=Salinarimonas ramus TaxID=690164 RepID=A0A917Q7D1_9HYPH|nr:Glu/Leu/Phe/Val dehydrogenase [Salinarimonas ramus]GGK31322.1 leucine dehydrogenase [Salinarimonas ramus]